MVFQLVGVGGELERGEFAGQGPECLLALQPGEVSAQAKVFTRDQLLANVWGVENIVGTRTVDVHIRRLRYKLETGATTYFRTVKNVGYGMMQPLST